LKKKLDKFTKVRSLRLVSTDTARYGKGFSDRKGLLLKASAFGLT